MSEEMKAKRKLLLSANKNGYDRLEGAALEQMERYCTRYKDFLNRSKTERETAQRVIELAQAHGFAQYQRGMALRPGDKVYTCNRGKSVMLAVIGSEGMSRGAQIAAAHIDSPRLDLKPHPLYEDGGMAYFKTQIGRAHV